MASVDPSVSSPSAPVGSAPTPLLCRRLSRPSRTCYCRVVRASRRHQPCPCRSCRHMSTRSAAFLPGRPVLRRAWAATRGHARGPLFHSPTVWLPVGYRRLSRGKFGKKRGSREQCNDANFYSSREVQFLNWNLHFRLRGLVPYIIHQPFSLDSRPAFWNFHFGPPGSYSVRTEPPSLTRGSARKPITAAATRKPDLLRSTTVVLNGTFQIPCPAWGVLLRLHTSRSGYIITSALKVLLSIGPFSCGGQVRCLAVVSHPQIDIQSARLDRAKP